MPDYCPTAFIISWPKLLNNTLIEFFSVFNSFFTRNSDGTYVCSKGPRTLKKIFNEIIITKLNEEIQTIKNDPSLVKHVFVVDTCKLQDNVLYDGQTTNFKYAYSTTESDISFDMVRNETIFDSIFNGFFTGKKHLNESGIKFIKHTNLSYSQIKNIIKLKYGTSKCIETTTCKMMFLHDLNDDLTIDKKKLTDSKFKFYIDELKQII